MLGATCFRRCFWLYLLQTLLAQALLALLVWLDLHGIVIVTAVLLFTALQYLNDFIII
jgi:hypothetical protein